MRKHSLFWGEIFLKLLPNFDSSSNLGFEDDNS